MTFSILSSISAFLSSDDRKVEIVICCSNGGTIVLNIAKSFFEYWANQNLFGVSLWLLLLISDNGTSTDYQQCLLCSEGNNNARRSKKESY